MTLLVAIGRLHICATFVVNRGFSIGIGDVTPGFELVQEKKRLVREG